MFKNFKITDLQQHHDCYCRRYLLDAFVFLVRRWGSVGCFGWVWVQTVCFCFGNKKKKILIEIILYQYEALFFQDQFPIPF